MSKHSKKRVLIIFVVISVIINSTMLDIINNDIYFFKNANEIIRSSINLSVDWFYRWDGGGRDRGYDVVLDSSGNVYVSGTTMSYGAGYDNICLLKFNSTGLKWNYTWGGSNQEFGFGLTIDPLGKINVVGETYSYGAGSTDICLVKFNSTGVECNYTWGGSDSDVGRDVILDSSGNIYVSGSTMSYGAGYNDICLVKFNSTGVEYSYTWGGSEMDFGNGIALDSSGNIYISGTTYSYGAGNDDLCLVKFNSTGVEWYYTWGGNGYESGGDLILDSTGNAYVSGTTHDLETKESKICLVKFNSTGVEWNHTWDGHRNASAGHLAMDSSGNIYVTGATYTYGGMNLDMCLVKFNSTGVEWSYIWDRNEYYDGCGLAIDSSGNFYISGYIYDIEFYYTDIFLVKIINGTIGNGSPIPPEMPDPLFFIFIVSIIGSTGIVTIIMLEFIRKKRRNFHSTLRV